MWSHRVNNNNKKTENNRIILLKWVEKNLHMRKVIFGLIDFQLEALTVYCSIQILTSTTTAAATYSFAGKKIFERIFIVCECVEWVVYKRGVMLKMFLLSSAYSKESTQMLNRFPATDNFCLNRKSFLVWKMLKLFNKTTSK